MMLFSVKRVEKSNREANHLHIVTKQSLQKTLYHPNQLVKIAKSEDCVCNPAALLSHCMPVFPK